MVDVDRDPNPEPRLATRFPGRPERIGAGIGRREHDKPRVRPLCTHRSQGSDHVVVLNIGRFINDDPAIDREPAD